MDIQEVLEKVKESKVFKEFHEEHKGYYLTHFFSMIAKGEQSPWQVGFYSKKSDKIVVFELDKEVIKHEEEDVFKKQKTVKELKLKDIMPFEEAIEKAEAYRKANHSAEIEQQKICILQNIGLGTVWNITIISMQFNMLNLKMRASDGHILKHSFDSILRLGKDKV